MSVYTRVSSPQLEQLLTHYDLGQLHHFTGIQAGIENTNYTVETSTGSYILTIYEGLGAVEIEPVITLMQQLNEHDYPVPVVQADRLGAILNHCKQKPAAFFQRLPGQSVTHPNNHQCRELGIKLAQLHHYCKNIFFQKQNRKNLHGCRTIFQQLHEHLSAQDVELIRHELSFQTHMQSPELPTGVIHADLFRDNVLFCDDQITGVLDFYTACQDTLILDLTIACNDWCIVNACFDYAKMTTLLSGYQTVRTLSELEQKLFPVYLRFAALRFWLSRLYHRIFPVEGEITQQKDPEIFRRILQQHILNPVLERLIS